MKRSQLLSERGMALLLLMAQPVMVIRAYAEPPMSAAPAAPSKPLLNISDAYVRVPPPGQPNAAAFMSLTSADGKEHELVSVSSPVAARCALHTHTREGGLMRMSAVPSIRVPSSGAVKFAPGGLHVMLLGLHAPLRVGDQITMTLVFKDGSSQDIRVVARGI